MVSRRYSNALSCWLCHRFLIAFRQTCFPTTQRSYHRSPITTMVVFFYLNKDIIVTILSPDEEKAIAGKRFCSIEDENHSNHKKIPRKSIFTVAEHDRWDFLYQEVWLYVAFSDRRRENPTDGKEGWGSLSVRIIHALNGWKRGLGESLWGLLMPSEWEVDWFLLNAHFLTVLLVTVSYRRAHTRSLKLIMSLSLVALPKENNHFLLSVQDS